LPVFDYLGEKLGQLAEIMVTAAHEIYVVKPVCQGEDELLLPVVAAYIREIDLSAARIVVDPSGQGGVPAASRAELSS
jgi:ribosomal 30S subunit maturation factor RimM